MAGRNYIEVEDKLPDKPQVFSIAADCTLDRDDVVGKLIRLWHWAGKHTTTRTKTLRTKDGRRVEFEVGTGLVPGANVVAVDSTVGQTGFGAAMVKCGWLVARRDGLLFPRWEKYNGKCDAARAKEAARKRKRREKVRASSTDVPRTPTGTAAVKQRAVSSEQAEVKRNTKSNAMRPMRAPSGTACTLLQNAGFDQGAIDAILRRSDIDHCKVQYACERWLAEAKASVAGRRPKINRQQGYIRAIIEANEPVPRTYRDEWNRLRMDSQAAALKVGGAA